MQAALVAPELYYMFIGGVGPTELIIVFAIILLIFGGAKLPQLARSMGQAMRAFKDESNKLKKEIDLAAEEEDSKQTTASSTTTQNTATTEESTVEQKN